MLVDIPIGNGRRQRPDGPPIDVRNRAREPGGEGLEGSLSAKVAEIRDRSLRLAESAVGSPYRGYTRDIAAAAGHLATIVNSLQEGGSARSAARHDQRFDLAAAAREAAGIVRPRAAERGVRIEEDIPAGPVEVMGLRKNAQQILLNLLINAVKFGPENAAVGVSLRIKDERAHLTVDDEGPGIPAADRERVFNAFERLGDRQEEGHGLGLNISRRLAEEIGARLTVGDAPGGGARFQLVLRLA